MDKSLAALLRQFDEMHAKTTSGRDGDDKKDAKQDDKKEESFDDNAYAADTEVEDQDPIHRQLCHNRRGMGGHRRREVHGNDDAFSKIKFKIPPFDGKYDPDAYITWEIAVDQKFACHEFPEATCVRAATSEFTDFTFYLVDRTWQEKS